MKKGTSLRHSAEKLRVRYSSLFHNIYSSLPPVVITELKKNVCSQSTFSKSKRDTLDTTRLSS